MTSTTTTPRDLSGAFIMPEGGGIAPSRHEQPAAGPSVRVPLAELERELARRRAAMVEQGVDEYRHVTECA